MWLSSCTSSTSFAPTAANAEWPLPWVRPASNDRVWPAVGQFDCHPEQAFFARRRIWASRAMCRVRRDTIIARLARFLLIKMTHYRMAGQFAVTEIVVYSNYSPAH